jgi:hypothetical protein
MSSRSRIAVRRRRATSDQVKDQLKSSLAQELATAEIKRLVSDAKVERFQEDGSPAKQGELDSPPAAKAVSSSAPAKSAQ